MTKSFTLIEMLVSIAIFSIIITVFSGIFVSASKTQRANLDLNEMLNESNYAMEYMSRAIRMAQKDVTGSCACLKCNYKINSSKNEIAFLNYDDVCQKFYLQGNQLMESKSNSSSPLTSNKFKVTNFKIQEMGWDQNDLIQPRVTLALEIQTTDPSYQPITIKIQTTVSQRNLDVKE